MISQAKEKPHMYQLISGNELDERLNAPPYRAIRWQSSSDSSIVRSSKVGPVDGLAAGKASPSSSARQDADAGAAVAGKAAAAILSPKLVKRPQVDTCNGCQRKTER